MELTPTYTEETEELEVVPAHGLKVFINKIEGVTLEQDNHNGHSLIVLSKSEAESLTDWLYARFV